MEKPVRPQRLRLLYLGFAFPPGLRELHPGINPAGNALESQMIAAMRGYCEVRSAGLLPFPIQEIPAGADPKSGIAHELLLVEQKPELWHRIKALRQLKQQYVRWEREGWKPDAVMVYNLSPVYNKFIRWLRKRAGHPKLVLLLLDSTQLGQKISAWKRFRYRLKPFSNIEAEMLDQFEACIGLSIGVKHHFDALNIPFLWMPGACTPERAPLKHEKDKEGPIRFCYFGALAPHAGVTEMVRLFLSLPGESELHICGYGKQGEEIAELAKVNARLKFHGMIPPDECLRLGSECDVLVNPRPPGFGNENNVASKLFDYGLCGQAIVAARISGTDEVMGPEAFYFELSNYEASLKAAMARALATPREELAKRGAAISERIKGNYNWTRQAERMLEFIGQPSR